MKEPGKKAKSGDAEHHRFASELLDDHSETR